MDAKSPASVVYYFRSSSALVTVSTESIPVFGTRLPKLQVGPNVPKRKPGPASAIAAVNTLMSPDLVAQKIQETRVEVRSVLRGLQRRADSLVGADIDGDIM